MGHVLEGLLGDAIKRTVVVEAKVAGVDDVVCAGVGGELVKRLQVSCAMLVWPSRWHRPDVMRTSDIRNAKHSYAALLNHAALVGEQRDSAGCRT